MKPREHLGWREWVTLPELAIERLKAKVDTGARTSALHAVDIDVDESGDAPMVSFRVHPFQRDGKTEVRCQAPLLEYRMVRSSNGTRERRPCIETRLSCAGSTWVIALTLTNRSDMGFRMLIGRDAIRDRFVVDPGRSFIHGRFSPPRPTTS